jgi:hypothetical protein
MIEKIKKEALYLARNAETFFPDPYMLKDVSLTLRITTDKDPEWDVFYTRPSIIFFENQ